MTWKERVHALEAEAEGLTRSDAQAVDAEDGRGVIPPPKCTDELCSHQQCATMRRDKRRAEWRRNEASAEMLEALQAALPFIVRHYSKIDGWNLRETVEAAIEKATKVQP